MRKIIYRGLITAVFICLIVSSVSFAGIVGSRHDLMSVIPKGDGDMLPFINNYGEVCVYCHTPHGAGSQINAPLWNRQYPGGVPSFTLYSSTTMDTTPGQPQGISLACLSCHDGTIAVDSIINAPGAGANLAGPWYGTTAAPLHYKMKTGSGSCGTCHTGDPAPGHDARNSYLGTNLSNDHPIAINYNNLASQFGTEFVAPTDTQKGWSDVKLYNGYVECSSCHDVHDPTNGHFLRASNSNSALCYKCHIK